MKQWRNCLTLTWKKKYWITMKVSRKYGVGRGMENRAPTIIGKMVGKHCSCACFQNIFKRNKTKHIVKKNTTSWIKWFSCFLTCPSLYFEWGILRQSEFPFPVQLKRSCKTHNLSITILSRKTSCMCFEFNPWSVTLVYIYFFFGLNNPKSAKKHSEDT